MTQTSASERKDVRKAEKAAVRFERERVEGLRHLISTYGGRLWLWRQLETANVFSQTFTSDPHTTAFNEGRRSLGLNLLADLMTFAPETFLKMMEEHNVRSSTDRALTDRDASIATGGHPVIAGSGPDSDGDRTEAGDAQHSFALDADYDPNTRTN